MGLAYRQNETDYKKDLLKSIIKKMPKKACPHCYKKIEVEVEKQKLIYGSYWK